MATKSEIEQAAQKANGNRRQRKIENREIETLANLIQEHENDETVHTIRVYSRQGFVPNSYKYRCEIGVIEATRGSDGKFRVNGFTVDAKRSGGNGALITINGRAA